MTMKGGGESARKAKAFSHVGPRFGRERLGLVGLGRVHILSKRVSGGLAFSGIVLGGMRGSARTGWFGMFNIKYSTSHS